jgi:hypothetical protein
MKTIGTALAALVAFTLCSVAVSAAAPAPATPAEMVATYDNLATGILALKATEDKLVRSILAATYGHAQAQLGHAQKAIKAGDMKAARAAVEDLAADTAQLGTEGDSAVGAVRKRLIEGGHHHHADGEAKGMYDPGFVVVTRAAKQAFLDSSRAMGQMASAPKGEALEAEWKKVQAAYSGLMK